MSLFQPLRALLSRATAGLQRQIDEAKVLSARLLVEQQRARGILPNISAAEFQVFSQFGDDGITQYLFQHIPTRSRRFIEIGVQDYRETNTRLLVVKDNWSGLIIEAHPGHVRTIRQSAIYWRHDLTAIHSWVTRDNINRTVEAAGFSGQIDLLSIDVDGNDYWIWQAMDADATVVVIEYNSVFGSERALTIPYDERFARFSAHYSGLYWGASLTALVLLAQGKGYAFVGCNSAGNNAYFVKQSELHGLPVQTAASGYVASAFRESRDRRGRLSFLRGPERLRALRGLRALDPTTGELVELEPKA